MFIVHSRRYPFGCCYFSLFMCSPLVNLYPCIPGQHMDSQPIEVYIYAAWGAKVCRMRNLSNFWISSLFAGHDLLLLKPSKSPPSPAYTCISVWSATINQSIDQTIEQSTNQSVNQINQSNQNQSQFKSNPPSIQIKFNNATQTQIQQRNHANSWIKPAWVAQVQNPQGGAIELSQQGLTPEIWAFPKIKNRRFFPSPPNHPF